MFYKFYKDNFLQYSNEKILIQLVEFLLLFFDANDLNCLWIWSKSIA